MNLRQLVGVPRVRGACAHGRHREVGEKVVIARDRGSRSRTTGALILFLFGRGDLFARDRAPSRHVFGVASIRIEGVVVVFG